MCIVLQTVAMIIEAQASSAGTGIWCGIPVSILNQNLNSGFLQKVITTKDLYFVTYCFRSDRLFFYFDVLQQELCRNFTLTICKHMVPLLLLHIVQSFSIWLLAYWEYYPVEQKTEVW